MISCANRCLLPIHLRSWSLKGLPLGSAVSSKRRCWRSMRRFPARWFGGFHGSFSGRQSTLLTLDYIRFWDMPVKSGISFACPKGILLPIRPICKRSCDRRMSRLDFGKRTWRQSWNYRSGSTSKYWVWGTAIGHYRLRQVCQAIGLPLEDFIKRLEDALEVEEASSSISESSPRVLGECSHDQSGSSLYGNADGYWKVPPGLTVPDSFKNHDGPRKITFERCDRAHMAAGL